MTADGRLRETLVAALGAIETALDTHSPSY